MPWSDNKYGKRLQRLLLSFFFYYFSKNNLNFKQKVNNLKNLEKDIENDFGNNFEYDEYLKAITPFLKDVADDHKTSTEYPEYKKKLLKFYRTYIAIFMYKLFKKPDINMSKIEYNGKQYNSVTSTSLNIRYPSLY